MGHAANVSLAIPNEIVTTRILLAPRGRAASAEILAALRRMGMEDGWRRSLERPGALLQPAA